MGILKIAIISFIGTINFSAIFSSAFFGNYDEYCSNFFCGRKNSTPPFVRYPFKFLNQSKEECGYPGFDLGCDSGENITLNLPNSGEFYVGDIDYYNQDIQVQDPQGCFPGRLFKLLSNSSISSPFSPFTVDYYTNYTFLSCKNHSNIKWNSPLPIIDCMSNSDVFIMASSFSDFAADKSSACELIGTVAMPVRQNDADPDYIATTDFTLSLSWKDPLCLACVAKGGFCRFAGEETICTVDLIAANSSRWKRWEKFLKIVGFSVFLPLAILPIFFFIVLLFFGSEERRRNLAGSSRFSEMIQNLTAKPGLEGDVIESYPKMVVDERLGNVVGDVMCCICLDEYVAGDILRSLPEWKHYFHVECIDEWLKINRTCPVCRV